MLCRSQLKTGMEDKMRRNFEIEKKLVLTNPLELSDTICFNSSAIPRLADGSLGCVFMSELDSESSDRGRKLRHVPARIAVFALRLRAVARKLNVNLTIKLVRRKIHGNWTHNYVAFLTPKTLAGEQFERGYRLFFGG